MFGQTVTASGDTMRQYAQSALASPRKWVGADIECEAGCGVVPFRYREQNYVNALQWAIGLEIFLLVNEPVARGADHRPSERRPVHQLPAPDPPADGPQLPRRAAGASCIPTWRRTCALRSITRELTLYEIAIMTRAAPARLLGLTRPRPSRRRRRGRHRGLPRRADREAMFATPAACSRTASWWRARPASTATPVGGTHSSSPDYDRGDRDDAAPALAATTAACNSITWRSAATSCAAAATAGACCRPPASGRAGNDRRRVCRQRRDRRRHVRRSLSDEGHAHR